jgi:hypothetical protein
MSYLGLGPNQRPVQWVPGALFPGIMWPGSEADHSPPSSVEVKNDCVVPPLLHTSSWHGPQSINYRGNFASHVPMRFRLCFLRSVVSVSSSPSKNTAVYIPTKGLSQPRVNNAIKIAWKVYTLLSIFQQTSRAPRGRFTAIWQSGQQGIAYAIAYNCTTCLIVHKTVFIFTFESIYLNFT